MPKWIHEECGKIVDDTGAFLGRANSDADAINLCSDHNAERDELQRRLDAVVAKISEAVVSDDDCVCSMLCHSAIIAIAEGRDNE